MDDNFPVGRPSLLFFPEEICDDYNFFHVVLGTFDAGDKGFTVLEKLAAKCFVLFADGGIIAIGIHLAAPFFAEGYSR